MGRHMGSTKNPSHLYSTAGVYPVTLIASNAYSSDTIIKYQYIHALNGGINETNTTINGLTITNCGGPQTVIVDTSVLHADLIPNKFVMEIQPPGDRGLKNITIYAQNGIGFTRNGNLITGNPTGVHLVSQDIAPPAGFSDTIGTMSSFNYSTDLPSYPCNAVLSTNIWEGILPAYETKLPDNCFRPDPGRRSYRYCIYRNHYQDQLPLIRPGENPHERQFRLEYIDGPLPGAGNDIYLADS